MKSRYFVGIFAAISGIGLAWAPAMGAVLYTVTDLGTDPGDSYSIGYGINNAGQVAATSTNSSGRNRASLYTAGSMFDLGTLGSSTILGNSSWGYAINASGQVTGFSAESSDSLRHAFITQNVGGSWQMSDLGTFGSGGEYWGNGINASGAVAGEYYYDSEGIPRAFVKRGGHYVILGGAGTIANGINDAGVVTGYDLGKAFVDDHGAEKSLGTLPGGTTSAGDAINAIGEVTGTSTIGGDTYNHAFLYDGTSMLDLGTLPGMNAEGHGINSSGVVVGTLQSPTFPGPPPHGFVYVGAKMLDLNSVIDTAAGWTITAAYGINDNGWITGYGTNNLGQLHAFILTPVPEPLTVGVLCMGLPVLLCKRRRQVLGGVS